MPKKKPNKPEILTWRGHYAGFASRLMAVIIDLLILAVVLAVTFMLYDIIFKNLASVTQLIFGKPVTAESGLSVLVTIMIVLITFAIYFIFMWTMIGSTIGGLIIGIKIVNGKGKHPNFLQALIRFTLEFAILIFGIIGAIWILFSRRRRALFDRFAGTFVLYDWDAKPDETFLKLATDNLSNQPKEE